MKKKNNILRLLFLSAFLFGITVFCSPQTIYAKKELKSGNLTIDTEDKSLDVDFKLPKKGIYFIQFDLNLYDKNGNTYTSDGKTKFYSSYQSYEADKKGNLILDVEYNPKLKKGSSYYTITAREDELPAGKYNLWASLGNSAGDYVKAKGTYSITYYSSFATKISVPSKITVKTDGSKKLKISSITPSGTFPVYDCISSNKKIATPWIEDGHLYVCGKKQGKCTFTIYLENGKKYKCKVTVKDPSPTINYTSYELYRGESAKLQVKYSDKKVKWSTSDKSVATVDSKGNVKAIGSGSCTVTGKIGSKKYQCKITVYCRDPNFGARLIDYNTRDNYFVVAFKNNSTKSLTISSAIKVENCNYKVYDRYISLPKSVTLKPGEAKRVKFKVKGSVTWYKKSQYTLFYKFKYDGKTYEGHVWDDDSSYKKGKKWYHTYWTDYEEWYESWWPI